MRETMFGSAARILAKRMECAASRRFRLNPGGFTKLDAIFTVLCLLLSSAYGQSSTNQFRFEDYLLAPVRIHLLKARDFPVIQTTLTQDDITRILGKINGVWSQAGLHFYTESLISEEADQPEIHAQSAIQADRSALLGLRPKDSFGSNAFHIYYLKQLPMNGIYFPEGIFVKDTASLRPVAEGLDEPLPRVTSHELGHALNLPHRQNTTNLMASGTTGRWLNDEEVQQARATALKLNWISSAPDLMQKANTLFRGESRKQATALYSILASIPLKDRQVELAKSRSEPSPSAEEKENKSGQSIK
jgi:hypothetical protein